MAVISPPPKPELPVHWAVAQPDDTQSRGARGGRRIQIDFIWVLTVVVILVSIVFLALIIATIVEEGRKPSYYVKIDAIAGLDPETDLQRTAIDPVFNLTLRLASHRDDKGVCFEAGTIVEVYYAGVLLAGAAVPKLCSWPRRSALEGGVVAWGRRVPDPVPRLVREALVEELLFGGGTAEFAVLLTVERYTGVWDVMLCTAKVGDDEGLTTPCRLYAEDVDEPVLQPGYGRYSSPQAEAPATPESGEDAMGAAYDAEEEEKPILPISRPAESDEKKGTEDQSFSEGACACLCLCGGLVVLLAILAGIIGLINWAAQAMKDPQYAVEITAVSGLDPATDLISGRAAVGLDPVFNLTVSVASTSTLYGACIDRGSSAKISYSYSDGTGYSYNHKDLQLASGMVQEMCVPPMGKSEQLVVARGVGVSVPGFLLGGLADEMRRGEAVFDVKLITRHENGWQWSTVTCSGRVGTKSSSLMVVVAIGILLIFEAAEEPGLSVAIATVSGLDPATDLARPTVDPQFHLTLGVASRSRLSHACFFCRGTAVAVSYHGVQLATAPVTPRG
uniref:Late embryogenesis abundant protein LEA-2 subgroup domain-containing protein n=1 Tax=Leersia perrieri TaxID=77586 RepID=A0A0D9VIE1_9ORYZ